MKVQFRAGELLFREGDPANRFYLIEDGEVVLEADAGERAPALIQAIGAGDMVERHRYGNYYMRSLRSKRRCGKRCDP